MRLSRPPARAASLCAGRRTLLCGARAWEGAEGPGRHDRAREHAPADERRRHRHRVRRDGALPARDAGAQQEGAGRAAGAGRGVRRASGVVAGASMASCSACVFAPLIVSTCCLPFQKWNEGSARTPWLRISLSAAGLLSPITCTPQHTTHTHDRRSRGESSSRLRPSRHAWARPRSTITPSWSSRRPSSRSRTPRRTITSSRSTPWSSCAR